MYQSGRAGDEAKKHKSPAKSRRVGISVKNAYPVEALDANGMPGQGQMRLDCQWPNML